MPSPALECEADLLTILRDVLALARHGSFPVASRRFGELRLEDGRHQRLELAALRPLGRKQDRLAASRSRLLRLEAACATALERGACAEYEVAAEALEQELRAHAALEEKLNRSLQQATGRSAPV